MAIIDTRICFVGDSYVNGTGDEACLGWAGRISARLKQGGRSLTYYNLGVRRDTSVDVRRRCAGEVSCRLDTVDCDRRLVLSFGTNDSVFEGGRQRVPLAKTIDAAEALLVWCGGHYSTLFVGPPPVTNDSDHDQRIAEIVREIGVICNRLAVPFIDLHSPLAHDEKWARSVARGDGFHPDAAGYEIAAETICQSEVWNAWFQP